jgi:putative chitinase
VIDTDFLRALGATQSASALYAPLLAEACPAWGIDEPREVAAFLANCAHESAQFSAVIENLNYSAQGLANTWNRFSSTGKRGGPPNALALRLHRKPIEIANVVYANRGGNGDENSGDGWTFRGRGLIQTTFKDNYAALANDWGVDVVSEPDILLEPDGAVVSACRFWRANGCNELAVEGKWNEVRRVINGGYNGLGEVAKYLDIALQYLGAEP